MKKLFAALLLLLSAHAYSQVVINELMYAPVSPAKEWFELYNTSTASVNLQGWKWKDAAVSNPVRTITNQSILLQGNAYAVICEDSANFRQYYPAVNAVVIQSIGWNALNNTGTENLVLFSNTGLTEDSLTYASSWGGTGGYSIERVNPLGATNQQSNWGSSVDIQKSTPGRLNSLTPKQYDLQLRSFTIIPVSPNAGDTLKLNFTIRNTGLNPASNFSLNIYNDVNFDSIPIQSELIKSNVFIPSLNTNDTINYTYLIPSADSGKRQYIGVVLWAPDQDFLNNKLVRSVITGGQVVTTGILINEIMYSPQAPEPEWIEFYNNSNSSINIKNWKIADESALTSPVIISTIDRIINPNEYFVISKSNAILSAHPLIDSTKVIYLSGLPVLNNDRDRIVLFNNASGIVDEVSYSSSWGGYSRNSLERISFTKPSQDSTNWMTSLDCEYSSPTRVNSFSSLSSGSRNDLVINEIMFDPLTFSCEWIEFYNNSGKYLSLKGWRVKAGNDYLNIFQDCRFYMQPGSYLVLSDDSTLFNVFGYMQNTSDSSRRVIFNSGLSLSNTGSVIAVFDALKNTIDSLAYSDKWHNNNLASTKGYSLERINISLPSTLPSNWSSSADALGGTPGKKNSIYTSNNIETSVSISPNPFSPDGDGRDDFTIIKYKLKANTSQVRIKVFDVKGRAVRTLINNQISGSESQIVFDGKDDAGEKLRTGIYVAFLEAVDDRGGTIEQVKATFVVAAKL